MGRGRRRARGCRRVLQTLPAQLVAATRSGWMGPRASLVDIGPECGGCCRVGRLGRDPAPALWRGLLGQLKRPNCAPPPPPRAPRPPPAPPPPPPRWGGGSPRRAC